MDIDAKWRKGRALIDEEFRVQKKKWEEEREDNDDDGSIESSPSLPLVLISPVVSLFVVMLVDFSRSFSSQSMRENSCCWHVLPVEDVRA